MPIGNQYIFSKYCEKAKIHPCNGAEGWDISERGVNRAQGLKVAESCLYDSRSHLWLILALVLTDEMPCVPVIHGRQSARVIHAPEKTAYPPRPLSSVSRCSLFENKTRRGLVG